MKTKKTNLQAGVIGAAVVAIPFGLWIYLLAFKFCVECDTLISFGIILPAIILGCPLSLIWLVGLMQVQFMFGVTDVPAFVTLTGYVVCAAFNGALIGFFRNKKRNNKG